jgi:ADP-ribose pyrophosphatase
MPAKRKSTASSRATARRKPRRQRPSGRTNSRASAKQAAARSQSPQLLFAGRYLRVLRDGRWEYAARRSGMAAVAIVAVTPDDNLLLVEQYRHPVAARVIELPAGLVGDEAGQQDEALIVAAERELLEETGYHAAEWRYLCEGPPTPGFCSEVVALYRALSLTKVAQGGGTGHENIVVHEVPLAAVRPWLEKKVAEGLLVDIKIYAALHFLAG